MRKLTLTIILILVSLYPVQAARYAGDAFSLGVGGRGMAMGGAVVAGPFDGSAAYWNPAGMLSLNQRTVTAMHAETFGSLLNHDFVAYMDSRDGRVGMFKSFGFYLYYLGGGGIKITALNEFNRPEVVREESHGDYLLTGSIAGSLTDKLDFGLTAKIIYRDIGTETGQGLSMDAGLLYHYADYLNFGLMVSDITTGFIRYSGETFDTGANSESIYPTMKPGLLLTQSFKTITGRFAFSSDIKFENIKSAAQYWSGPISFDTHYGLEIDYKNRIFTRAGFDIGNFTAGLGFLMKQFAVDVAYLHHDDLDATYRVSGSYSF